MDLQNAPPREPSLDDAPASVDSRRLVRARIMRQQAMLEELAQVGADVVRAIGRRARAVDAEPVVPDTGEGDAEDPAEIDRKQALDDLGLTYTRVTRAIRLTFLLQAKFDQALEWLASIDECDAREVARERARVRQVRGFERKARVQLVVERVAQGEHPDDAETVERLIDEACEWMREDDGFGPLLAGPFSAAIDAVCCALGLSPDWPRLAETRWAQEEIRSGKVGAPLAALAKKPPNASPRPPTSDDPATFTFVIPPLPPKPRRSSGRC